MMLQLKVLIILIKNYDILEGKQIETAFHASKYWQTRFWSYYLSNNSFNLLKLPCPICEAPNTNIILSGKEFRIWNLFRVYWARNNEFCSRFVARRMGWLVIHRKTCLLSNIPLQLCCCCFITIDKANCCNV